jgi:hypothetical protein
MKLQIPTDYYTYRRLNLNDKELSPLTVRRRLNNLKKWANSCLGFYPDENYKTYWNCKLPITDSIVCKNPSKEVVQECLQALVNAVSNLIKTKKQLNPSAQSKILCLISDDLYQSEITIFFDKAYYTHFFNRTSVEFSWTPINDQKRSLLNEFNLIIPDDIDLLQQGYVECIVDEEFEYKGELWAIGELGAWL